MNPRADESAKRLVESETLIQMMASLTESLPKGVAELKVREASAGSAETLIGLTPRSPASAPVVVHTDEGDVIDVVIGRGGFFEVDARRGRYTSLPPLDEIRALVLAAVRGDYRETIWVHRGEVVRSIGIARIGTREVPIRWAQLSLRLLQRPKRVEIQYVPYDDHSM